jgi:predicted outer membrane repeat protein
MIDCVFKNNSTRNSGAGVCNYDGNPTFTACKFIGNLAGVDGGGISSYYSRPMAVACTTMKAGQLLRIALLAGTRLIRLGAA